MNLTLEYPRSAKEKMAGLVSLGRMLDKARAAAEGSLGDYHYDCPHDKPVLAFLGVDAPTFKDKAATSSDREIEAWVRDNYLTAKSPAEISAFNEERESWRAEPGTESAAFFEELRRPSRPTGRTSRRGSICSTSTRSASSNTRILKARSERVERAVTPVSLRSVSRERACRDEKQRAATSLWRQPA